LGVSLLLLNVYTLYTVAQNKQKTALKKKEQACENRTKKERKRELIYKTEGNKF
jgi:hypothetical protein